MVDGSAVPTIHLGNVVPENRLGNRSTWEQMTASAAIIWGITNMYVLPIALRKSRRVS